MSDEPYRNAPVTMVNYSTRPLVKSAVAHGRWVTVTTYVDGETPVVGNLLFETEQDAQTFAQFITHAMVAVPVTLEAATGG